MPIKIHFIHVNESMKKVHGAIIKSIVHNSIFVSLAVSIDSIRGHCLVFGNAVPQMHAHKTNCSKFNSINFNWNFWMQSHCYLATETVFFQFRHFHFHSYSQFTFIYKALYFIMQCKIVFSFVYLKSSGFSVVHCLSSRVHCDCDSVDVSH